MMHYWHEQGWSTGQGFGMLIATILVWLAFVLIGVMLLRAFQHRDHVDSRPSRSERRDDGDAAIAVLKDRFARGELNEDEFLRRLALLRNS